MSKIVDKTCQRCGGPRTGTKYCRPCSQERARERSRHPERLKPCPDCGKPKEPGKRRYCIACWEKRQPTVKLAERDRSRYKSRRQREARGIQPRRPKIAENGDVWCTICHQYLPPQQFSTRGNGRYNSQCRSCYSTYLHEQRLQAVYGITLERYEELHRQQDGCCAICMRKPRTRRLAVDHDHETGAIRGLLCTRCNHKVLGGADESPTLLRRAARYLEAPPAKTGATLEALGDANEQRLRALCEAASHLGPGDVETDDRHVVVTVETFLTLAQVAGWSLVVDGKGLVPDRQMSIDSWHLVEKTWRNAEPILRSAASGTNQEALAS